MTTFKDLLLSAPIQKTLETLGFTHPTEIQNQAIPVLLEKERVDFHGQAQTGTGKTLAFGLPLLQKINPTMRKPQALIVAPTRELAQQICDSLKPFAQALGVSVRPIYGGASMEEQMRWLREGIQIVVGTPGRLNDHLERKTLNLGEISTLVLDEADIMLDMGFKDEVYDILKHTPSTRAIWLFSATVKSGVYDIMQGFMHDPVSVRIAKKESATPPTKQLFCVVPTKHRLDALCRFIEMTPDFYGFVFCQTKILASEIAEQLAWRGYKATALHGDLSQAQRNITIKKFKNKEITIVVATDVAARGIDVANLTHVINYSMPEDLESYVHRIGRTGRAGKEGTAITFINRSDVRAIDILQRKFKFDISQAQVPSAEAIFAARLTQAQVHLAQLLAKESPVNPGVLELVAGYSTDDLKTLAARLITEKFLSLAELANLESPQLNPAFGAGEQKDTQEMYLTIGSDDGITQDEVRSYIVTRGGITDEQIKKLRLIKRRTFFEIPETLVPQLMDALKGGSLAGRPARIFVAESTDHRFPHHGDREGHSYGGPRRGEYRGGGRGAGRGSSRFGGDRAGRKYRR